jgi:hypothetical protein
MVRFDACLLLVALQATLVSCGGGSHQAEPPAAVPAPAVQPQDGSNPTIPSAPSPKGADPKAAPKDSGGSGNFPWQSSPIAEL